MDHSASVVDLMTSGIEAEVCGAGGSYSGGGRGDDGYSGGGGGS